jgi:hypothetical protein
LLQRGARSTPEHSSLDCEPAGAASAENSPQRGATLEFQKHAGANYSPGNPAPGGYPVPGSLDKKGGRRCHLLHNKRWHLLPLLLSNEPGTGLKSTWSGATFKKFVVKTTLKLKINIKRNPLNFKSIQ